MAAINSESAQPSLNRNFIHPHSRDDPSAEGAARFGGILGALDDKGRAEPADERDAGGDGAGAVSSRGLSISTPSAPNLFKVIRASHPRWLCYLGIHLHLEDFRHIAVGKATPMGHIQRHHLSDARLAVPPPPLMSAANEIMEPIIESLWHREVQSRTLATIRDALLPRLISGELRVKGAERVVAEAAA